MISALKSVARWIVRSLVYAYLAHRHWTLPDAERWAERLKAWPAFFAQHPFSKRIRVRGGALIEVGLIDVIERHLLVAGRWEEHVESTLESMLQPGACFLDVGSNIGHFTLLAAKRVGASGTVIAVEPCWQNLSKLARNLALNQADNVYLTSIAAGALPALGAIAFPTLNNAGAATMRAVAPEMARQCVLIGALDDSLESCGFRPSLIKIDVEGFELQALRGLKRCLEQLRPAVILELTPAFLRQAGDSATALLQFMADLGYRCDTLVGGRRIDAQQVDIEHMGQIDVIFRPQ